MKKYRQTPIMGWASWNCYRTHISEEIMKRQADLLISTGLADCGYRYLNMDDGFFGGREENGRLRPHPKRFPNGIGTVAEYAHSLGLKAGIYSEGGDNTCGYCYDEEGEEGKGVGLYGHEEADLSFFLEELGFDFIKIDWCGGIRLGLNDRDQYTKVAEIIERIRERTGREIVFNICRWQFPGEWAVSIADSWRTGADITPDFQSVLRQIDNVKCLRRYCSPGHVNDLDMMQIGNGMTPVEEKTHFIMWCMMSTPLMIGCDLVALGADTLELLKNRELIALDQDPACRQAYVIREYREGEELQGEIWYKVLQEKDGQRRALAFLNRSDRELAMELNLSANGFVHVNRIRDLFAHRELEPAQTMKLNVKVAPRDVAVFEVWCEEAKEPEDCNEDAEFETWWHPNYISYEEAMALAEKGAYLIDVRSSEEYQREHIEGAVNIPHTSIFREIGGYASDRERDVIITYCRTGKRCTQAELALEYLYYKNLYILIWREGT